MKKFFIGIVVAANVLLMPSLAAQNQTAKTAKQNAGLELKRIEMPAPQAVFSHGNENSRNVKYTTDTRTFKTRNASEGTRAFPIGTQHMAIESYFWGWSEYDVTIRQDEASSAKYWFATLLPARPDNGQPAQTVEIYATLANGVFTIPIGQSLGQYENPADGQMLDLTLRGISLSASGQLNVLTTGNITATLNERTIVFDMGFGSQTELDFWCGIMLPGGVIAEPGYEPVKAYYREPAGMLYYGFIDNGSGSAPTFLQAVYSPYSTWEWRPKFIRDNATYLWEYNEFITWEGEAELGPTITSNDVELSMDVETESYMFPKFTGISDINTESYIENCNDYPDSAWIYAGNTSLEFTGSGYAHLTNANLDYGLVRWTSGDPNNYVFGTGGTRDALISCFEKPASTLYFTGINILIGNDYVMPTEAELYLDVYAITYDEGGIPVLGDQLATATANTSNILRGQAFGHVVFDQLSYVDEDGFETQIDYLEVNTEFALVFSGYNIEGAQLVVLSEFINRADGSQYSFYISSNDGLIYETTSRNNMYMHLINGTYSYIVSDQNKVQADNAGGDYTVTLTPMFNGVRLNEELPEWITSVTFDDHFTGDEWYSNAKITVAALPSEIQGRTVDLVFATTGARVTVTVSQGVVDGVAANKIQETNVASTAGGFELKYGADFNRATLYNLSGKTIGTYELPKSGNFTIPAGTLTKGIYMIQFTGKTTETVKVVK